MIGLVGVLVLIILLAIAYFPGVWLGKWWAKKESGAKAVNIFMYLNVIAWIFPMVGFFVSGLTLALGEGLKLSGNKYKIWAYGGMIVSIINAIAGAIMWQDQIEYFL